MARTRKKSTSTNPVLHYKPNQFPGARLGKIQWKAPAVTAEQEQTVIDPNTDEKDTNQHNDKTVLPGTPEYYASRFDDA